MHPCVPSTTTFVYLYHAPCYYYAFRYMDRAMVVWDWDGDSSSFLFEVEEYLVRDAVWSCMMLHDYQTLLHSKGSIQAHRTTYSWTKIAYPVQRPGVTVVLTNPLLLLLPIFLASRQCCSVDTVHLLCIIHRNTYYHPSSELYTPIILDKLSASHPLNSSQRVTVPVLILLDPYYLPILLHPPSNNHRTIHRSSHNLTIMPPQKPKTIFPPKLDAQALSSRYCTHPSGYIYGKPFPGSNLAIGILEVGLEFEVMRVDCVGRAFMAMCVRVIGMEPEDLQLHIKVEECALHFNRYRDCECVQYLRDTCYCYASVGRTCNLEWSECWRDPFDII